MPQTPAQMKRHPLNVQTVSTDEKLEDTSVISQPSHAILGHIAIKNYANDGILATAVTMRYKDKVTPEENNAHIVCNKYSLSSD